MVIKKYRIDFINDVKENKFKKGNDSENQKILKNYKDKWNLYLKGTEKLAFYFLDPKLHPMRVMYDLL